MQEFRTVSAALAAARSALKGRCDTPSLDAQLLLSAAVCRPRSWLLAHPEAGLSPESAELFEDWLAQRVQGVPLPYLLGEWEFYGRKFHVCPDVLIPRPETELLIEHAVNRLQTGSRGVRVLDVGTGSGCIAVTLALAYPDAKVLGLDISEQALQTARKNADRYAVRNLQYTESDLLQSLPSGWETADLICANLPYIPSATLRSLEVAKYEPLLALDGGENGLDLISRLLQQAVGVLADEGLMLLEIEAGQGKAAVELARRRYPDAHVACRTDLAGHPRLVTIDRAKRDGRS